MAEGIDGQAVMAITKRSAASKASNSLLLGDLSTVDLESSPFGLTLSHQPIYAC